MGPSQSPTLEPWRVVTGFAVSAFVGAIVLWLVIDVLAWSYVAKDLKEGPKPRRTLTVPLGIVERIAYTGAIMLGAWAWIGVWLAVKVAAQWKRWEGDDRALYNVFLIGNLLSIFFGVLGAWVALGRIPALGTG